MDVESDEVKGKKPSWLSFACSTTCRYLASSRQRANQPWAMSDDDDEFVGRVSSSSIPGSSRPSRQRIREQREAAAGGGIKVKLGANAATTSHYHGVSDGTSGLGWDREIDSDPEDPLVFEEQFILRVPLRLAPTLRKAVESRAVGNDIWFKFKDSRRAVYHQGEETFRAKLVDLPTLVESQKMTGLGGASVKVADISQMLLVEEEMIQDEAEVTKGRAFNIEDFIFPHGITPPLKHVRKRRFRKRANKRVSY